MFLPHCTGMVYVSLHVLNAWLFRAETEDHFSALFAESSKLLSTRGANEPCMRQIKKILIPWKKIFKSAPWYYVDKKFRIWVL